ncbi:hypothetical protein Baya_5992 [Bagarius yarrelli]|uniref:Uncharacterized protein n=1 Tax=Bagarius yarrelli TaxID=175774 RepID=A0A556U0R0_BAGYA|nr:hypothetical protein Baya_5992 [Bagarius yarrelli]
MPHGLTCSFVAANPSPDDHRSPEFTSPLTKAQPSLKTALHTLIPLTRQTSTSSPRSWVNLSRLATVTTSHQATDENKGPYRKKAKRDN